MNNSTEIAQSTVLTLLHQGIDFIIEDAIEFVKENRLDKALQPSQISHIQNLFYQNLSNPEKQKKEIKKFIERQVEKDKKQGGKGWTEVGESLYHILFDFSHNKDRLLEHVKSLLKPYDFDNELEDLLNTITETPEDEDKEAVEWLKKEYAPAMSQKILAAIVTVYNYNVTVSRCKKAGLSMPGLWEE